eukprot:gb/GECH01009697.1/.p1 GENE.gb/GECH01009697.1/~~gb/GECH01009697.1/.p1  ORF type:complete len:1087 (+),score=371.39 gb/GECH01009697.1/:1-3261(+)
MPNSENSSSDKKTKAKTAPKTDKKTTTKQTTKSTKKDKEKKAMTKTIIKDSVAVVDVGENQELAEELKSKLTELGVKVKSRLMADVTHLVFKDGKKASWTNGTKKGLKMVSPEWVEACKAEGKHISEADYPAESLKNKSSKPSKTTKNKKTTEKSKKNKSKSSKKSDEETAPDSAEDEGNTSQDSVELGEGSPSTDSQEKNNDKSKKEETKSKKEKSSSSSKDKKSTKKSKKTVKDENKVKEDKKEKTEEKNIEKKHKTDKKEEKENKTEDKAKDKKVDKKSKKDKKAKKQEKSDEDVSMETEETDETKAKDPKNKKRKRTDSEDEEEQEEGNEVESEESPKKKRKVSKTPKKQRKPNKVFVFTGISESDKHSLKNILDSKEDASYTEDFTQSFTHIVVNDAPKRTLKVLFAIARGAHFVSPQFLFNSLDSWPEEREFEVSCPFSETAEKVRSRFEQIKEFKLRKQQERKERRKSKKNKQEKEEKEESSSDEEDMDEESPKLLLEGKKVALLGRLDPGPDTLGALVKELGGHPVHSYRICDICIVAKGATQKAMECNPLSKEWLLDAVTHYELPSEDQVADKYEVKTIEQIPLPPKKKKNKKGGKDGEEEEDDDDSSTGSSPRSNRIQSIQSNLKPFFFKNSEFQKAEFEAIGDAFAWGQGARGAIGDNDTKDQYQPKVIPDFLYLDVLDIACVNSSSAVLLTTKMLFTWGSNDGGKLGHGDTSDRLTPTLVKGLENVKIEQLSIGAKHMLAVDDRGSVWCWGNNKCGQLGIPDIQQSLEPQQISSLENIVTVHCGLFHSAAITQCGQVFTWGQGSHGELGHGCQESSKYPNLVSEFNQQKVSKVALGMWHSLALTIDGNVYSWGEPTDGQLGNGDITTSQNEPSLISKLADKNVVDIAAGGYHCACVTDDGKIYSWGNNIYGQLGIGEKETHSEPMLVSHLSHKDSAETIVCGANHCLVRCSSGKVYAWGAGTFGRLGIGLEEDQSQPYLIEFLLNKKVRRIAAGGAQSACVCAHMWVPDKDSPQCMKCNATFSVTRRRHHCRNCGGLFCANCTKHKLPLIRFGYDKPVRVCDHCFSILSDLKNL